MKKILLLLFCITLVLSCNRNTKEDSVEIVIVNENETDNEPTTVSVSLSLLIGDNRDLLTDHYWFLSDGRRLVDQSISTIDWMGPMTPRVIFYKLEVPLGSVFYQYRLRRERLEIVYQSEETKNLYRLENSFSNTIYSIIFNDNFTQLTLNSDGYTISQQERVGQQSNSEHSLVGTWGRLPNLAEYRLIDPADCLYYMEIDREIPFFAIRRGTYLLKQIDEKTFETVSAFSDGRLRLEITGEREMLLIPLFTLPEDEEGIVGPLLMHRSSLRISEAGENDFY